MQGKQVSTFYMMIRLRCTSHWMTFVVRGSIFPKTHVLNSSNLMAIYHVIICCYMAMFSKQQVLQEYDGDCIFY